MKVRLIAAIASWLFGIAAAAGLGASSAHLALAWARGARAAPRDKAVIEGLQEKGQTDAGVQPELRKELDRQRDAAAARRNAYDRWGAAALVASAVLVAWARWLRPGRPARRPRPRVPLKTATLVAPPGGAAKAAGAAATIGGGPEAAGCRCAEEEAAVDLAPVEEIVRRIGRGPDACIPILQAIQDAYRHLPAAALRRVTELTEITAAQIAGVSTFYSQFRHRPVGRHILRVCEGTACHVAGSPEVAGELRRCLGMAAGADTDPGRRFTIERVACVGSCSLAPVVVIDEKIYGHATPLTSGRLIEEFLAAEGRRNGGGRGIWDRLGIGRRSRKGGNGTGAASASSGVEIRVGLGSCGIASGALDVQAAIDAEVRAAGGGAVVKAVGCSGQCHREPLVEVVERGRSVALYGNVRPADAPKIVGRHVPCRGIAAAARRGVAAGRARLLHDSAWTPIAEREFDPAPYAGKQVRIVLENCGSIDPLSLAEYRARGGYAALEECLRRLRPEEVVEKVKASGLRGRGGAGFPTGTKWEIARRQPGGEKYMVANGDEGDPGAFMDRAVLESDPHRVIEGLAIAAYAIGASRAFAYVRREYPIAVRHARAAIAAAEGAGLLGDRILGTDFSLRIEVREGAGAFVCGEETALLRSIEGFRGMPRLRPPFPAQSGLWGKPTVINNVETLAGVPWIIRNGPEKFAAMGTEGSKGTKVFSLAGKVRRGGLIEVPMGITIREIVEDVGGGVHEGHRFKAVLIGGPSGGCLPERLADTRIDYQELTRTGAIMGSGGLVVLDDRDCAVEIARYFLHFTQNESCGKCTYCRVGTKRMLEILERICAGEGDDGDLETLESLADRVKRGSLCGLGQTAPNPVLTTLRYFRGEYEAHVREGRCPAGQCKALIRYAVTDRCTGCTLCAQACPAGAIEPRPYERHEVIDERCTRCGMCLAACPENSVTVTDRKSRKSESCPA